MSAARKQNEMNIAGVIKAGPKTENVTLTDLTMTGCTAILSFPVTRHQALTLQLYEKSDSGQIQGFSPVSAVVLSVNTRKNMHAVIHETRLSFNTSINEKHGVAQAIKNAQMGDVGSGQRSGNDQDGKKKSTLIVPVTCHMCGHEHIPFRTLQKRVMKPQANIFGVQQYIQALPGKEPCDYNLVRSAICPTCFFASGYVEDFIRESRMSKEIKEPFDREKLAGHWVGTASKRRQLVEPLLEGLFSENRTLDQALLAYDLAIMSCNYLLKFEEKKKEISRDYKAGLKAVNYMLIKAELLMTAGQANRADGTVKKALAKLEEAFPYLRKEASIKGVFLMGMIGLYLDASKIINHCYSFLREYDKYNKVKFGTDEHKALVSCQKRFAEAFQSRGEFLRGKLTGYNKPFDY